MGGMRRTGLLLLSVRSFGQIGIILRARVSKLKVKGRGNEFNKCPVPVVDSRDLWMPILPRLHHPLILQSALRYHPAGVHSDCSYLASDLDRF